MAEMYCNKKEMRCIEWDSRGTLAQPRGVRCAEREELLCEHGTTCEFLLIRSKR